MNFLEVYGIALAVILLLMTLLWLYSLRIKNSSIVDIFWGTGFVILNLVYFALSPQGYFPRQILISTLVSIWGLRLSTYILQRNMGKGEDFRYRKWREEAGTKWWWQSFFRVFVLQGILLWIISIPLLAAQYSPLPEKLILLDFLGVIVWLVGFYFESMGDYQLARFKANPANKGKILNSGVWRYTRHPNYFGDATQWWGFFLIAAAAGGWWTIFSPLIMTWLLMRVSGVTLLEQTMSNRPGYQEYVARTSAFFPWKKK